MPFARRTLHGAGTSFAAGLGLGLGLALAALLAACSTETGDAARSGAGPRTAPGAAQDPAPARSAPTSETRTAPKETRVQSSDSPASKPSSASSELATFGAGCFWCVEAVLQQLHGVLGVESGYMGGHVENPTYQQVCSGTTGHAEVVQVRYDPAKISYEELLAWFWQLHDPTTKDRQGNDVGPQYRSVIFWHTPAQREAAEKAKREADASGKLARPIVTEITEASTFYAAEQYHQDYYWANKQQGYCRAVIAPKLEKLGLEK